MQKGSKEAYQKRVGKVFFEILGIRLEEKGLKKL
tara:strand:- start:110 stop:211 length:102 start_codon:yes stop_codon:yes gene_type:complete